MLWLVWVITFIYTMSELPVQWILLQKRAFTAPDLHHQQLSLSRQTLLLQAPLCLWSMQLREFVLLQSLYKAEAPM